MSGIYRHPKSPYWQYDFQHKGRRYHGSTGCTAKAAAEKYVVKLRHELLTAAPGRPPITLDEACGLYADKVEAKPSWKDTRSRIERLIDTLGGNRLLSEIGQGELARLVARRRAQVKDISINREIEDWRAIWRWASRNRYDVGEMPDWAALKLPVPDEPPRELGEADEAALFRHFRADLQPFARFALKSGWRLREIIALCWADLDLEAKTARVRVKGGNVRNRPLSAQMLAIITSQPRVCPQVFTYVSHSSRTEGRDKKGRSRIARRKGERYPLSQSGWRKPWAKALEAAGIEALRFHDLRHTTVTRVVRATGNLAAAQRVADHASIKTTMRYAHVQDQDVRDALDAIEPAAGPRGKRRKA